VRSLFQNNYLFLTTIGESDGMEGEEKPQQSSNFYISTSMLAFGKGSADL